MNTNYARRDLLGVIGGMGPLASAEFLKTIYEYNAGDREQESPPVVMYSDPTFPDRTESFLVGALDELLVRLTDSLERLCDLGASRLVICCFTMHYLVPRLPDHLRKKIWSLIEVALTDVVERRKKHLLICTSGSRRMGLFENHGLWNTAKEFIVLPEERDQGQIHKMIYQVKSNYDVGELAGQLLSLLSKYGVDSFVAGCTEIHLLAKCLAASDTRGGGVSCIDPLIIIAKRLGKATYESTNSANEN